MININIPPSLDEQSYLKYLAKPNVAKTELVLRRELLLLISHLHVNGRALPLGSLSGK